MIRELKVGEIPFIAEHYARIMGPMFVAVGEDPISSARYVKILNEHFSSSKMFVFDDHGIKAFQWFMVEDDEMNLEELFSVEEGKGYGTKLFEFTIDYAKRHGIRMMNMDVHFMNDRALRFFKKFGFTELTIELSREL